MPVFVLPLIAGVAGFGTGFWTGSTTSKLLKVALIGGGCYVTYKVVKEAK